MRPRRRLCVSRIGAPTLSTYQPASGSEVTFGASQGIPIDPRSNWSDVIITLGNFGNQFDDPPSSITLRLAVEYPPSPAGIYTPLFGPNGARDITLEPGAVVDVRVPFALTGGDMINLRYFAAVPTGGKWTLHERLVFYASPGNRYETPATDKTLSGSISGTVSHATIPSYVMSVTGIPDSTAEFPTIALDGDSISVGAGEATATIEQGFMVRALQNNYGWVHLGQSGGSYSQKWSTTGKQLRRWQRRSIMLQGVTHMLCNNGTNDIGTAQNNTAEATIGFAEQQQADLAKRGIVMIPMTIMPRTDAANSGGFYSTDTVTQWNRRDTFNAWVRTNPFGTGYFDASAFAEDPVDHNKWRSDLGSPTADGLHPAPAIHAAVAAGLLAALPTLLVPRVLG